MPCLKENDILGCVKYFIGKNRKASAVLNVVFAPEIVQKNSKKKYAHKTPELTTFNILKTLPL